VGSSRTRLQGRNGRDAWTARVEAARHRMVGMSRPEGVARRVEEVENFDGAISARKSWAFERWATRRRLTYTITRA